MIVLTLYLLHRYNPVGAEKEFLAVTQQKFKYEMEIPSDTYNDDDDISARRTRTKF